MARMKAPMFQSVVSEAASILEAEGYSVEVASSPSSSDLALRVEPSPGGFGKLVVVDFKEAHNGTYLPSSTVASGMRWLASQAAPAGSRKVVRVLSTNLKIGESGTQLLEQLNADAAEPIQIVQNVTSGRELANAIAEQLK